MLALVLVLPPAGAAPTCPAGWTPSPPNAAWGPRCFLVPPERSTSLSRCVYLCAKDERGGIPACIGSAEENNFVTAELAATTDGLWLGLYKNETGLGRAKGWGRCVAGDAPSFSNWDEPQPDDHLGYQQDCAWVDARTGRWRDIACVPLPQDELSCLCTRGTASAAFADELKALNTTCDTDKDCTNGYLTCNGNKVCGCFHGQGAALDEDGMCRIGSTWQATTHFVVICIYFIISMLILAYHTYATWLVVRLGAKGAVRKSAFLVELALLSWMAGRALFMVKYSNPSLFGARPVQTVTAIYLVLLGAHRNRTHRAHAACSLSADLVLGAGSRHYHWLFIRHDVPRAPVDRVRDGKHTCRIRVLPPEARPEVRQHLDDLIRRARHSPARPGAGWVPVGQHLVSSD